jgi:hypothetical protein
MRTRFSSAFPLALALTVAALTSAGTPVRSGLTDSLFLAIDNSDTSRCCEQEAAAAVPKQKGKSDTHPTAPDHQIVFRVEGLTCPAVKGIGCGHMLRGVLVSLDKINGVGASSANYTGTMIRISVTSETDRDQVAEAVRKVLTEEDRKVVLLAGDELRSALDREEWREAGRIGELSAIEFHTLALHWVKTFAKAEKLDKKIADELVQIAEQQWERVSKKAKADGATQPEDWGKRTRASLPAFLERAKRVLTAEQVERLRQTPLTGQRRDCDCPEAPPAPARRGKPA